MEQLAILLRELVYDAAIRCDDLCKTEHDGHRVELLDDIILLLSQASADAKSMLDTILDDEQCQ